MAKLQAPTTAGYNAGKKDKVKLIPIEEIKIDPEIAKIFEIDAKTLKDIQQKIEKFGYNEEEPVVIWKGKNILVDGRTRYTGAKNAGLKDIPAFEREFENREEAIIYTIERQVIRRNLTAAEIMIASQMIKGRKEADGTGRAVDNLAKKLGVSPAHVYAAKAVMKEGSPEVIKAVKKGKMSIKEAYNETKGYVSLPMSATFLKGAVMLLIEAGQKEAAKMLINHFLKKNEKAAFYKLLPAQIAKQLPRLPLLNPEEQ